MIDDQNDHYAVCRRDIIIDYAAIMRARSAQVRVLRFFFYHERAMPNARRVLRHTLRWRVKIGRCASAQSAMIIQ